MKIGQKIKSYREKRNFTQTKLAEISGVSQTYISELESNKSQPTVAVVVKLAKALGISVDKLLEDDEEPVTVKKFAFS